MMKLGIRVSSDHNSGLGHFYRCLSIREKINNDAIWFLDSKNKFIKNLVPKIDKIYYEKNKYDISLTKKEIKKNVIDLILIDTYSLTHKNILQLSAIIPVAIFLDKKKYIKVQISICAHPIKLINNKSEVMLSGTNYAPILKKYTNTTKEIHSKRNNILISMGAYDSKGITLKVIKAIEKLSLKLNYNVTIVIGEKSPIINDIKSLIYNLKQYKLLIAVNDMNYIYDNSDVAIGAPGLSQFERAYKGLPTILIAQNNIHKDILKNWVNLGCAIKADNFIKSIADAIHELIKNKFLQKKIITNCLKAVDGQGSDRIMNEFKNYVNKND